MARHKSDGSNGAVTPEKPAARPRKVSDRIAATLAKLDELRQLEADEQKRQRQRVEKIVARAIMSGIEDDPEFRATIGKVLTDRVTKPAEREALQSWLMPLSS
jgi:hypothetical protein